MMKVNQLNQKLGTNCVLRWERVGVEGILLPIVAVHSNTLPELTIHSMFQGVTTVHAVNVKIARNQTLCQCQSTYTLYCMFVIDRKKVLLMKLY